MNNKINIVLKVYEDLKDIAETHASCEDRLSIEKEKVERVKAQRDALLEAMEYRAGVIEGYDNDQEAVREEHRAIAKNIRRDIEDALRAGENK